jgi:hypothetical protein
MDKPEKKLLDMLEAMFASSFPEGTVTVVPLSVSGDKELLGNQMEKFDSLPDGTDDIKERFFFTLVGMAQWAVAHPSTSRYEYLSPGEIKSNKNLKNAFMTWWYNEHPDMKPEQENQPIKDGLFPGAVIEHTADGHHPFGWSWGSESYLSDFYLCLTYAAIQEAIKFGYDVKEKFAPIYIAKKIQHVNRVEPTRKIVDAMNHLLNEAEPNATRPYGVISGEVN